jgi:hypothetical protein
MLLLLLLVLLLLLQLRFLPLLLLKAKAKRKVLLWEAQDAEDVVANKEVAMLMTSMETGANNMAKLPVQERDVEALESHANQDATDVKY